MRFSRSRDRSRAQTITALRTELRPPTVADTRTWRRAGPQAQALAGRARSVPRPRSPAMPWPISQSSLSRRARLGRASFHRLLKVRADTRSRWCGPHKPRGNVEVINMLPRGFVRSFETRESSMPKLGTSFRSSPYRSSPGTRWLQSANLTGPIRQQAASPSVPRPSRSPSSPSPIQDPYSSHLPAAMIRSSCRA